jgi:hypothetical protein
LSGRWWSGARDARGPGIRQHTSAYVSIRQKTSAFVGRSQHTSESVSIRKHMSASVSICQHPSAYVSIRQHPSAYLRETRRKRSPAAAAASVFVLMYQQLRQHLYFCTSQPADDEVAEVAGVRAAGSPPRVCDAFVSSDSSECFLSPAAPPPPAAPPASLPRVASPPASSEASCGLEV